MSKRWTLKDDHFLVRYHEIGADYVASHDLGFKKGAGTKRVKALKAAGVWDLMVAAQRAVTEAECAHTIAFSKSAEARSIAVETLIEIDDANERALSGGRLQ